MMHFGITPRQDQAVAPSLSSRGLHFLKAAPSHFRIHTANDLQLPLYGDYLRNFPAFVQAALEKEDVPLRTRCFAMKRVPSLLTLPFKIPPVVTSWPQRSQEIDDLITKLRGNEHVIRNKACVEFPNLRPQDLTSLLASGANATTFAIYGTSNIDSVSGFLNLRNILSGMLVAHRYPAFIDNSHVNDYKGRLVDEEAKEEEEEEQQMDVELGSPRVPKASGKRRAEIVYVGPDKPRPVLLRKATYKDSSLALFGTSDLVPTTYYGLVFPFISDLALPDDSTVLTLIHDYMFNSLASLPDECAKVFDLLQSSWGILKHTDVGMQVTHFCKVFSIALSAQSVPFPIFEDEEYLGSVILGAGYTLYMENRKYVPLPHADYRKYLSHCEGHSQILRRVEEMCKLNLNATTSMRSLASFLEDVDLDKEGKEQIVKFAFKLKWKDLETANPVSVAYAIELILNPSLEIPEDYPLYPEYLFETNRTKLILAAFGTMVPSLEIPNGALVDLTKVPDPPTTLYYKLAPLPVAYSEFVSLMETKTFHCTPPRSASVANRLRSFKKGEKDSVWKALVGLVGDPKSVEKLGAGVAESKQVDDVGGFFSFF